MIKPKYIYNSNKALSALFLAVIAISISPFFVRWAEAPGLITTFYRMFFAMIVLTPFFGKKEKEINNFNKKVLIYPIIAGLFTSLDHALWAISIEKTTITNASLLNSIFPLWVVLFAVIFWKEQLSKKFWLGLTLVFIGTFFVLGNTLHFQVYNLTGDIIALLSSTFYAAFFLVTQRGRKYYNAISYLFITLLSATLFLGLFIFLFNLSFFGYTYTTYFMFIAAALFSQVGGYFLITYALGQLSASIVSPTITLHPVLTAIFAMALVGERLVLWQIIGFIFSTIGVLLINYFRKSAA